MHITTQEQEETNDSEVEPTEEYPQSTSKVNKEVVNESVSGTATTDVQAPNTSSADEEAVNKVAEKIDTLRMGPRQVRNLLAAQSQLN